MIEKPEIEQQEPRRWSLARHELLKTSAAIIATLLGSVVLVAGTAVAYYTATGSGTGSGSVYEAVDSTIAVPSPAPSADANLYPGGPGVDVHFTVDNQNPYDVTFTGWSAAGVYAVTPMPSMTCTTSDFQIATGKTSGTFKSPLVVTHNTSGTTGTAQGVLQILSSADNGCQGATVTVSLTLTGAQS